MAHELSGSVEIEGRHYLVDKSGNILEGPFKFREEADARSRARSQEFGSFTRGESRVPNGGGFGQPIDPSLLGPVSAEQVPAAEQAPPTIPALQLWLQTIGAGLMGAARKGSEALEVIRKSREAQAGEQDRALLGQAVQAMSNLSRLEREGRLEEAEQLGLQWAATTSKVSPTLSVQFRQLADAIRDRRTKVAQTEAALTGIERAVAPGGVGPIPGMAELVPAPVRPEVQTAIEAVGQRQPVEQPQALLTAVRRALTPGGVSQADRQKLTPEQGLIAKNVLGRTVTFTDELQNAEEAGLVLGGMSEQQAWGVALGALSQGRADVYSTSTLEPELTPDRAAIRSGKQVIVQGTERDNLNVIRQLEPDLRAMLSLSRRIMAVNPGGNLLRAVRGFVERGLASNVDLAVFEALSGPAGLALAAQYAGKRASDLDLKQALLAMPGLARDRVDTAVAKLEALMDKAQNAKRVNLGLPIPSELESVRRRTEPIKLPSGAVIR